jgi:hypothetical protein
LVTPHIIVSSDPEVGAASWQAGRHQRAVHFHLALYTAIAVVGIAVLKMEGPYYADYMIAGFFGCAAVLAAASLRNLRRSAAPAKLPAPTLPLVALIVFFIASAIAITALTKAAVEETAPEPEEAQGTVALHPRPGPAADTGRCACTANYS